VLGDGEVPHLNRRALVLGPVRNAGWCLHNTVAFISPNNFLHGFFLHQINSLKKADEEYM
jgi:hypothetical protein